MHDGGGYVCLVETEQITFLQLSFINEMNYTLIREVTREINGE